MAEQQSPTPLGDYFLTTIVRFKDGSAEGQVLHVGSKDECEKVANMLPAIAYSGDREVTRAEMAVLPQTKVAEPFSTGQRWRMKP